MNIWQILEIEPTRNIEVIKQAYVKKIKQCKPEVDPQGFQQARNAYEKAQKYAAGFDVEIEFDSETTSKNSESKNTKSPNTDTQTSSRNTNPSDAAFYLLDVLFKNEKDALDLLNEYQQKGTLDNLEFSDQFQKTLAINLLTATAKHYYFICYAIDLFKWYEHPEIKAGNSFFGIALINLINQTRTFRFILNVQHLSQIKNKTEAKEKQLNWPQCYAAKIFLNPAKPWKFFFIKSFGSSKKQAIIALLDTIIYDFPEAIGLGLKISSVAWWHKNKNVNYLKRLAYFFVYFFVGFIVVGTILLSIFFDSFNKPTSQKNLSLQSKSNQIITDESQKSIINNPDIQNTKKSQTQFLFENRIFLKKINLPYNYQFDNSKKEGVVAFSMVCQSTAKRGLLLLEQYSAQPNKTLEPKALKVIKPTDQNLYSIDTTCNPPNKNSQPELKFVNLPTGEYKVFQWTVFDSKNVASDITPQESPIYFASFPNQVTYIGRIIFRADGKKSWIVERKNYFNQDIPLLQENLPLIEKDKIKTVEAIV